MVSKRDKQKSFMVNRWRSPLLWLILAYFAFESLSGFAVFFFKGLLPAGDSIRFIHWVIGAIFLLPYAWYQREHYIRVQNLSASIHYKFGILTFIAVILVSVSGAMLLLPEPWPFSSSVVDLAHVMTGFAFVIFIACHLTLLLKKRANITQSSSNTEQSRAIPAQGQEQRI